MPIPVALSSRSIVGFGALRSCLANPWYDSFPLATPRAGIRLPQRRIADPVNRELFARRFTSSQSDIADRIDAELRR
jgi:hypothetical protein